MRWIEGERRKSGLDYTICDLGTLNVPAIDALQFVCRKIDIVRSLEAAQQSHVPFPE